MNFTPSKISENFILDKLKSIKGGTLNLQNYNQERSFLVNQAVLLKQILLFITQNFILIS